MKSKLKVSFIVAFIVAYGMIMPVYAEGIPVIDPANLPQAVLTAYEEVAQTLKQIEQFEKQVTNTTAPFFYVWDQANLTMEQAQEVMAWMEDFSEDPGGLNMKEYLKKFGDVDHYRDSPCFKVPGCTPEEWAEEDKKTRDVISLNEKLANNALFKNTTDQMNSLKKDAENLGLLQGHAQAAKGRLEAIGYANQLASHQSNQLMQIRAGLTALMQAEATKAQSEADLKARQQVAGELSSQARPPEKTIEPINILDLFL